MGILLNHCATLHIHTHSPNQGHNMVNSEISSSVSVGHSSNIFCIIGMHRKMLWLEHFSTTDVAHLNNLKYFNMKKKEKENCAKKKVIVTNKLGFIDEKSEEDFSGSDRLDRVSNCL